MFWSVQVGCGISDGLFMKYMFVTHLMVNEIVLSIGLYALLGALFLDPSVSLPIGCSSR